MLALNVSAGSILLAGRR